MHMKKISIAFAALLLLAGMYVVGSVIYQRQTPIKVGILHSLTGHMAVSERPVVDAALLAIEEINASGGLLGRRIEPIIADGASDAQTFARQAEMLITEKKVEVIFGCWTSASFREVKAVVEKYDNVLFFPVQYEGVDTSSNIIYTGATANQQIFPGVLWCAEHIGKRFFIVGTEEIYSAAAGVILHSLLDSIQAPIVGEEYMLLGSKDVDKAVEKIKQANPDVIINTMNGETNLYFFRALRAAGIASDKIPTVSFCIGEPEVQEYGVSLTVGDYASWSYFQSVQTNENIKFVEAFKKRYGQDRVLSDPMEAAYFGVYLWSQTVQLIKTANPVRVVASVPNQSRVAPEGIVAIDAFNHNTWKVCRVAKINDEGQFDVVWSSEKAVYPVPYLFKARDEWEIILQELYTGWGGSWAKKG